jgi:N-acetyl-alpha-D-muramate 1-phosphate uridylyltransferase
MILAAGRGERLRPLTDRMPKPLIPIAGEPLVVHQIRWLERTGIRDIVINLHHLGDAIERALGDGSDLRVRIAYSRERERLETGGGVRAALPLLGSEPFALLNGDIWTDYDFGALPKRLAPNDLAHVVLTARPAHRDAGDFDLRGDRVVRPVGDRPLVYCGIALVSPRLLDDAPAGPFSLRDLYFRASAEARLAGERFGGRWIDIGNPEQLRAVRRLTD